MGFLEVLTLILIVLKLMGIISWGWFSVFFPLFISLAIYFLIFMGMIIGGSVTVSKVKRRKR